MLRQRGVGARAHMVQVASLPRADGVRSHIVFEHLRLPVGIDDQRVAVAIVRFDGIRGRVPVGPLRMGQGQSITMSEQDRQQRHGGHAQRTPGQALDRAAGQQVCRKRAIGRVFCGEDVRAPGPGEREQDDAGQDQPA